MASCIVGRRANLQASGEELNCGVSWSHVCGGVRGGLSGKMIQIVRGSSHCLRISVLSAHTNYIFRLQAYSSTEGSSGSLKIFGIHFFFPFLFLLSEVGRFSGIGIYVSQATYVKSHIAALIWSLFFI